MRTFKISVIYSDHKDKLLRSIMINSDKVMTTDIIAMVEGLYTIYPESEGYLVTAAVLNENNSFELLPIQMHLRKLVPEPTNN